MTEQHLCRMNKPCPECPFRTDVPVGRFPPGRFDALRDTIANGASLPQPMFGCHKTSEATTVRACAGWLVVCGERNLSVRLALVMRRLPPCALERGDDWPELYPSYEAMAEANGA